MLAGNASISYVYTKDEIMSVAGAFYALPVFGAAVYFLREWPERRRSWAATAAVCALFIAGSSAWAIRAAGVHHVLRSQAFVQRNDWTRLEREWRRDGNWERYASSAAADSEPSSARRFRRGSSIRTSNLDGWNVSSTSTTDVDLTRDRPAVVAISDVRARAAGSRC